MAASVRSSQRAIEVSVYVVRAFVRLRELAATHGDLAAKRLDELENKTKPLAMSHDTFRRNTRKSVQAGLRRAARTHDTARSAQAADRVRHYRGQGEEDLGGKRARLGLALSAS